MADLSCVFPEDSMSSLEPVPNAAWQPRDSKGRFKRIRRGNTAVDFPESSTVGKKTIVLDSDTDEEDDDYTRIMKMKEVKNSKDTTKSSSPFKHMMDSIEDKFGDTVKEMHDKIVAEPAATEAIVYDYIWGLYDDVFEAALDYKDKLSTAGAKTGTKGKSKASLN